MTLPAFYWRQGAPERRRARPPAIGFAEDRRRLRVGLVNNMPDAALLATERQFRALIQAAAPRRAVELLLFHVPAMARGNTARARLKEAYRPADQVACAGLDALVVTGAEPRAAELHEEPFWPALARLADWAERSGVPSLWSCLGAHAAVLRLDGIVRRPLPAKCSGLFPCTAVAYGHPLLMGRPRVALTPHSRGSGLDEADLRASGYTVLTRAGEAGVDSFVRGTMLFLQGHPEYEPASLALEFRRDLGRYLEGVRAAPPASPTGVFGDAAQARLHALVAAAERDRSAALMERWPRPEQLTLTPDSWRAPAARLLRNWLEAGRPGASIRDAPRRAPRSGWNHPIAAA